MNIHQPAQMNQFKNAINALKTDIQACITQQNNILNELIITLDNLTLIETKLDKISTTKVHEKVHEKVITSAEEWLKSWKNNKNTGSNEEIRVGLEILLSSGLESRENIPDIIKKYSIPEKFNITIKKERKVLGILNLSQADDDGGTADIALVYQDGTSSNYSVTQWYGKLKKCLCNPSPMKTYNLQKHKKILEEENKNVYKNVVKIAEDKYGAPSKKWKRKKYSLVSVFTEKLARIASEEWNALSNQKKKSRLLKILDLDESMETRSDGIIYFNKTTNRIECVYDWTLKIDINQCLESSYEKCYIVHYLKSAPNEILIKTQAKYNNGVIEGLNDKSNWKTKPGRPFSSWNCVADLNKIFAIKKKESI